MFSTKEYLFYNRNMAEATEYKYPCCIKLHSVVGNLATSLIHSLKMFWKKKIPDPKKGKLNALEQLIIDHVAENLPANQADKLKGQIRYLILLKRLEYNNDTATELYPESFNGIPDKLLFGRTEEFKLAHVRLRLNGVALTADIYTVLGTLFEIRIKPKISMSEIKDASSIEFIDLRLEANLDMNINGGTNYA